MEVEVMEGRKVTEGGRAKLLFCINTLLFQSNQINDDDDY